MSSISLIATQPYILNVDAVTQILQHCLLLQTRRGIKLTEFSVAFTCIADVVENNSCLHSKPSILYFSFTQGRY